MGRRRRRAGALRRPAPRGGGRRAGAGEAAPRRPHARRQPELGEAAAARRLLARKPVRRHAGAERRHGHAPGAGRARHRARRAHLGDARRRHAAGHRDPARQGRDRAVPRHRRHALVGPAARPAPSSTCCGGSSICPAPSRPSEAAPSAQATREVLPPSRVLDGFGAFQAPPPTARPVAANYSGRAKADNPPGFYGPPEGLLAVNTLVPADRLSAARRRAAARPHRGLPPVRAARPARADLARRAGAAVHRRAGGVLARRRHLPAAAARGASPPRWCSASASRPRPRSPASRRPTRDQAADAFAMKATIETHLAYVVTGDSEADNVSKAGLAGPDAVSRPAHRARSGRAGRARPRRATSSPSSR